MLTLLLMLTADPLMPPPAEPLTAAPSTAPTVRIDADGVMRGVVRAQEAARRDCKNGQLQQAETQGSGPLQTDLMFRQGDPVQMTLLLERRVGQCSLPISYDVTTPDGRLPSFPARAD